MVPQYDVALADFAEGVAAWRMWGRLAWQEIKRRYRRTTIGPFWTSLSLGIFIGVLGVVWAGLWNQDPKTYLPFLCAGMVAWNFVQANINDGCLVFVTGEPFIKQQACPYSLLAYSMVWRNLILFGHNVVIFVAIAFYAPVNVNAATLLVIPGVILNILNAIWIATILGVVCARYRDVQQVVASVMQISMFVTPIFFTPEQLGPGFRRFVDVNLLYHFVDVVRSPLLGHVPSAWSWTVIAITTAGGWGGTLWLYSRFRRRVPYWL